MKASKYKLKIHESWIMKLVVKCETNLSALHAVKRWMDSDMDGVHVMATTVFVNSFSRCGAMDDAVKAFASIPDQDKDAKSVCAITSPTEFSKR